MCGLCGFLRYPSAPAADDQRLIERMIGTLAHRGPDDSGLWLNDRVALGSRRLSVIDLSSAGHQPMSNEDGAITIAYNGEVYNFRELRRQFSLDERGHVFRSRTDTEVLVHLYEELGVSMFEQLNGMFAMAIWDSRRQTLTLARDRYGIKPLFYHDDGVYFRFGSEIKAILADKRVGRRPSMKALFDYMSLAYIPGELTAFEGVYEVSPAHYMTLGPDGRRNVVRYWDLVFDEDESIDEETAVRQARELMERAVERRLIADVPVGVLLSGGLDSSTILALMSRHRTEPIHTYSVGFEDSSFNELPYARIMASEFETIHREVLVSPGRVRDLLPHYLRFIDEPYADGSAIPTYLLCELAKDEVVVVLSGEGGDEAFVGYDTYAAYEIARRLQIVPSWVWRRVVAPVVNSLPVSHRKLSLEFKLKRLVNGLNLDPALAHLWWRVVLTEQEKHQLFSERVREELRSTPASRHFETLFDRAPASDTLSKLLYIDSSQFLPDDLMIKNDRMSMAHSLEARVPFTDPELTSFLAQVPVGVKFPGLNRKHLMKAAMRDALPSKILGKKKVGLEMPYSRWFKGDLKNVLLDYLGPDRLEDCGLFEPTFVRTLVEEHLSDTRDNGRALWSLLNYMVWWELYIS